MTPTHEKIALLLFLVINTLFLIETLKLPVWSAQPESGFMPLTIVVTLYIMLTLQITRSLKSCRSGGEAPQLKQSLTSLVRGYGRPFSFLILTLLYVLALQMLGYYVSSFLFCLAFSLLFVLGRSNLTRSLIMATMSSAISLTLNYLLYERMFGTPLG